MALLARKLRYGFRCRVLGFDPYVDPRIARVADVELIPDLKALLVQSHILVLVPELTEETRNMIGAEELATLPQGAIVVNTGRGQVLQLAALASALDRGHIFALASTFFIPSRCHPGTHSSIIHA
jgi:D-3-phosphoglycerate dehydrogenase